jgi:hypothetical protein
LKAPGNLRLEDSTTVRTQAAANQKPKAPNDSETQNSSVRRPRTTKSQSDDSSLQTLLLFSNFALMLGAAGLLIGVLRNRFQTGQGKRRVDWSELIPLIGAFILTTALFLLSASAPPGGGTTRASQTQTQSGSAARAANPEVIRPSASNSVQRTNPMLSVVMFLIVLAAAYWAYRITRLKSNLEPTDPQIQTDPSLEARLRATNRVREAYKQFLEHCQSLGIERFSAQTSLEFANDLAQNQTVAGEDVLVLTKIYEPVRYGQLTDESGALEAERLVRKLKRTLEKPATPGETT